MHDSLIGFLGFARMQLAGIDLSRIRVELEQRIRRDSRDANALLDLSTLLFVLMEPGDRDRAFALQARALGMQQLYRLSSARGRAAIRLLAIAGPGDMTANTPIDCLLEDSGVQTTLLYVVPGRPLPERLPDHDVVFVVLGQSERSRVLFEQVEELTSRSRKPVLNRPERIGLLSRDRISALLADAPGVEMPATVRVDRERLAELGRGGRTIAELLQDGQFPIILRPLDSHGGKSLVRLDEPSAIAEYLESVPGHDYYISSFVDYRDARGLYAKCRIVLIEGRPYACHLALSANWMVHYANAGMFESAEKRAEEERFLLGFDDDFARRHGEALRAIHERIALDYVGIDCAETGDGKLLVFEVDSAMIVHAIDPPGLFPYKPPHMRKVFAAFRDMLDHAAARAPRPRRWWARIPFA